MSTDVGPVYFVRTSFCCPQKSRECHGLQQSGSNCRQHFGCCPWRCCWFVYRVSWCHDSWDKNPPGTLMCICVTHQWYGGTVQKLWRMFFVFSHFFLLKRPSKYKIPGRVPGSQIDKDQLVEIQNISELHWESLVAKRAKTNQESWDVWEDFFPPKWEADVCWSKTCSNLLKKMLFSWLDQIKKDWQFFRMDRSSYPMCQ